MVSAELTARTLSSCTPTRSPVSWSGEEQELNASLSRAHSNPASGSFDENVNSASTFSVEASGALSIVVSGGTTVHVCTAGVASTLPSSLTARTFSSYVPGSRPSSTCGGSHDVHSGATPGSSAIRHSKVAAGSFEEKVNVAAGSGVTASGLIGMAVSGATVESPATIANGDRLSVSPQIVPVSSSATSEMSTHSVPLWCSSRVGGSYAFGSNGRQTVTGAEYSAVVETS